MVPLDPADLAVIRLCERSDCNFAVNNAISELKDILQAIRWQEAVRGVWGRGDEK